MEPNLIEKILVDSLGPFLLGIVLILFPVVIFAWVKLFKWAAKEWEKK